MDITVPNSTDFTKAEVGVSTLNTEMPLDRTAQNQTDAVSEEGNIIIPGYSVSPSSVYAVNLDGNTPCPPVTSTTPNVCPAVIEPTVITPTPSCAEMSYSSSSLDTPVAYSDGSDRTPRGNTVCTTCMQISKYVPIM